jgi:inorganic pyrophosphatase
MAVNVWHELASGGQASEVINVVVEIPKGSRNKYEFHIPTGAFKLDRVLYSPVSYPGDYGFIPQTYDDDQQPLDALVVTNLPTFTGCIVEARPIGLFRMTDHGEPDDKIVAVLNYDPFFDDVKAYTDLPAHYLKEVEHFFAVYKDLEGQHVEPLGWETGQRARERIQRTIDRYWDLRAGKLPKRA